LTDFGNWSDRFVPCVGTCSGGVCICAGGALVCFGGLCSLLELVFDSVVSSRCPFLRDRVFPLSSDLALCLCLAFDCLFEFLLIVSILFLFSLITKMCLLSMHSSRGRLRTMCGSRTSGWSLPSVMSD
jgi:hypothetical protein